MSLCCILISVISTILLLTTGTIAGAQGQWVDDLYLVWVPLGPPWRMAFIDEKNHIQKMIPPITQSSNLPVPYELFHSHVFARGMYSGIWHTDALYIGMVEEEDETQQINEDGKRIRSLNFAKWQNDEWNYLGQYRGTDRSEFAFIPCSNDRYIIIHEEKDMTDNRFDASPFTRASFRRKELSFDSPIDHGQDDLQKYISNPNVYKLAYYSLRIVTNEHVTLVHPNTGLYWVFSLEKASLVKAGNIFKRITPEMVLKGGFQSAILCAGPEKEGTVLISALDEIFFTKTDYDLNKYWDDYHKERTEFMNNPPTFTDEEYEERYKLFKETLELREKEQIGINPFIVWYRIYPENGRVEKLSAPPEGGTLHREYGKYNKWRPMPDGSVRIGYFDFEIAEAFRKEQEKPAQGEDSIENKKEVEQTTDKPPKADNTDIKKTDTEIK